jgi:hypothetical protein
MQPQPSYNSGAPGGDPQPYGATYAQPPQQRYPPVAPPGYAHAPPAAGYYNGPPPGMGMGGPQSVYYNGAPPMMVSPTYGTWGKGSTFRVIPPRAHVPIPYPFFVPLPAVQGPNGGGGTMMVMTGQQVELPGAFERMPTACVCPNCHAHVVTAVSYSPGSLAWLSCLGLFIIGCWPVACVPFCIDSMQDVDHSCPSCGILIRRRSALS